MLRKLSLTALAAALVASGAAFAQEDHGEEGESHSAAGDHSAYIENYSFSFEGPFGSYDEDQLLRGLQVYTEVCSACHGLRYVPIRTLSDEGGPNMPEDQVRAYIEQNGLEVWDPALRDYRPATPNDNFPMSSLANAPDLSLMAKARVGGADYIASLLTHYTGEEMEQAGSIYYENETYGGYLAMQPPLSDGYVEFQDGSPNDLHHAAQDVAAFLMWAAEPHMMARKAMGFTAVLMLGLLSVLLYLTNKRIWAPIKARVKDQTPAE
ncbi:cytochrome c1 [Rhodobacterales bacterium HKCCE2091]|nr:cytochrome c1 [Rhodobacterales bacterium HKCCE2091]